MAVDLHTGLGSHFSRLAKKIEIRIRFLSNSSTVFLKKYLAVLKLIIRLPGDLDKMKIAGSLGWGLRQPN